MERIESLNRQLIDLYGIDSDTGRPIFRIVWSEDQFEKRLMPTTDEGLLLLYPEVREVPKYRQWITQKYVLERLVIVPDINSKELAGLKLSYEPLWVFMDRFDNALPPKIEVCKMVVDTVYAAQGKTSLAKYKDPENNPEEAAELKKQRVDQLVLDMFGDETDISDHLSRQTGVVLSNTDALIKES
jgi:hypothetical protein